ncbi:hypothetical protein B9G54_00330 [Alloscardovia macacae]|nr:hypothetical protein B9G54_00330 [Alloscardovia macacae]
MPTVATSSPPTLRNGWLHMVSRDPRARSSRSVNSANSSTASSKNGFVRAVYSLHDRLTQSRLARSLSHRVDNAISWLTRGSRFEHGASEFTARSGRGSAQRAGASRIREDYSGWRFLFSPLASYWALTSSVVVLTLIGLVMVFSSRTADIADEGASIFSIMWQQGRFALFGCAIFIGLQFMKARSIRKLSGLAFLVAMFLQALTLTPLGSSAGGNAGWLVFGSLRFQPAEVMKFALAVWLPHILLAARKQAQEHRLHKLNLKPYILPGVAFIAAFGLVMAGKDLGTGIVIVLIGVGAFFLAGFPVTYLLSAALLGGGLLFIVLVRGNSNRWDRIMAAYGGCSTRQAALSDKLCFQTLHGDYALATGGLTGVGLGNSREKSYLPAQDNDFIFAIIGEELGFIGALAVILCIAVMAWSIINLSLRHQSVYMQMVLMCFGIWFTAQSLINLAVVLGLLPVMGLPLPFISSGGSSLVMCLAGAGVCVRFAREQEDVRASRGR